MKIVTNIQRKDITFGKVFLYRFASIFSSQNHDTCSRSNASDNINIFYNLSFVLPY